MGMTSVLPYATIVILSFYVSFVVLSRLYNLLRHLEAARTTSSTSGGLSAAVFVVGDLFNDIFALIHSSEGV